MGNSLLSARNHFLQLRPRRVYPGCSPSICPTLNELQVCPQLSHLGSFDEDSSAFRSTASSLRLRLTKEELEVNQPEICSGVKTFFIFHFPGVCPLFQSTSPMLVASPFEVWRKITFYVNLWGPNEELQLLLRTFKVFTDKSSYSNNIKHISPRSQHVKKKCIQRLENWNAAAWMQKT